MMNYPFLVLFPLSLLMLWLAARIGTSLRKWRPLADDEREDFGFVQAATLTLLGLIIGFSFSMSISRYDQRKNYEEAEANAISSPSGVHASQLDAGNDSVRISRSIRSSPPCEGITMMSPALAPRRRTNAT